MFWLFAVAGNETLRNGIPGGLIALTAPVRDPAAFAVEPSPTETRRGWVASNVIAAAMRGSGCIAALRE